MKIVIENVSKSFDNVFVLKNINQTFSENGIYNLTGASGAGKTTLLRIIMGLEKPDNGSIIVDDVIFSPVFPENRLLNSLTAHENVSIVESNPGDGKRYLDQVGLLEFLNYYPKEMSTGMKRRVSLARALAFNANVLVLDEPFKGVDYETCEKLMHIIKRRSQKNIVILVDHNQKLVKSFSDYTIKLNGNDNQ